MEKYDLKVVGDFLSCSNGCNIILQDLRLSGLPYLMSMTTDLTLNQQSQRAV